MQKYALFFKDDLGYEGPAMSRQDDFGDWYRAEDVETRIGVLEEALQRISQWADAYPLDVFPEPDFGKVRVALISAGLSLDQVSASNMRHVITGVGGIAKTAVSSKP